MGSSCSTPWLLYNEGLLLVTGLQQTGGNGFCHERSHCMKSTERNFYSRSPRCLLFESGQVLSTWLRFFDFEPIWFGMFFCVLKIFFLSFWKWKWSCLRYCIDIKLGFFCHKHMNWWVSVCRLQPKCNCVCAVTP